MAVQFSGGISTFNLQAGTAFDRDGGFGYEFRPQVNFEFDNLNAGFDVFYQGRMNSNFGAFPLSRVGGGVYYFPFGLSQRRSVLDSGVVVLENRFVPFLLAQVALNAIAVTDTSQQLSFNGLTVSYQLGGGVELPVTQTWSMIVQLLAEKTMLGGVGGDSSSSISTSVYSGLIGFSIRP